MGLLKELLTPWESFRRIKRLETKVAALATDLQETRQDLLFTAGQAAAHSQPQDLQTINAAEFRVFSQFGEDGIIQFLVRKLDKRMPKTFVEFGVQHYLESNTLFLMMHNGWTGFVIDGEPTYTAGINERGLDWKYGLKAKCEFVSRDNINRIFQEEGYGAELGLLSIDVDGIDWHLWNALTVVRPAIVVMEYNRNFPHDRPITVPYEPAFDRISAHASRWYFGTSLKALDVLAREKGYTFVGAESHKRNAFFVRDDLIDGLPCDQIGPQHVDVDPQVVMLRLAGMPVFDAATKTPAVI